ncbi:MAG: glycosyltransferase [Rhizomicrobium sp.]
MTEKPVFFDASGKRAVRISAIGWTVAIVSTLVGMYFLASLFVTSPLSGLKMPGQLVAIKTAALERKAEAPGLIDLAESMAQRLRARRAHLAALRRLRNERRMRALPLSRAMLPHKGRPLSIAFFPSWASPDDVYPALKHALPRLDAIMPTWLDLSGPNATLSTSFSERLYQYVLRNKPNTAIVPVLQNASGGTFHGKELASLLANPARRKALVNSVTQFISAHHLQGICVDFENVPRHSYHDLWLFLAELHQQFRPHGWTIAQAAPFDDSSWPFAAYARVIDYTVLMAYDEHTQTDNPGAVAGQDWFESQLDKRMKVLAPSHTIIAIGAYGYDWNKDGTYELSFQQAMIDAHDAGADVRFDGATNNPHFSYDQNGERHDVWFLDAATAFDDIHAADIYQPAGYAVWRMGSEDPAVWSVMGRPYGAPVPNTLYRIPFESDIDTEGAGEILRVEAEPQTGSRTLEIDRQTGDIDDEHYTRLPSTYVVRQFGAHYGKEVALTFDDGPDPEWTPKILHILKEKHVPATFFIIGANAEANPGLVQDLVDHGEEVGDHTYTHPNLADTANEGTRLELNTTQRLFEALTGRSLRLFRPPYLGDAEPSDVDELIPVEVAQDLGYITVGEHVDPRDWARPGTQTIISRVMQEIHQSNRHNRYPTNIVLLHDGGGNRAQTVAALPVIIDQLRAQGYRFVRVSHLAGLTPQEAMPPLPMTVQLLTDRLVFLTMSTIGHALYWCFLAAIFLGIGRMVMLVGLALWRRSQTMAEFAAPPAEEPFAVSVIIPAYNEESVIQRTVRGILNQTYRRLELIIIDDGSKDNTSGVLQEAFGQDPRLSLVRVQNGGKARALNTGLAMAKGEIIVALDADTEFARDTIARLVRWFGDAHIGAVAGNAKVGNRINMITRWQALEYVVSQNLERRALAALGTLTVVPGAVGAWRKSVLTELGGFRMDTLAEDQDLTIAVQRAGWQIKFDSSAIAWTEAPTTVRGLAKQRFRWAFGTLQCLWKHRDMTFNRRYGALGMVALPSVWMFQIILTALAPLADLLLLWQLAWQYLAYVQHGSEYNDTSLKLTLVYYGIFVVVDMTSAIVGFLLEKREQWSLLWWLMLQRFGYRQIMYYVVVRSLWSAVRGVVVGWNKIERTGTVRVREAPEQPTA